MDNADSAVQPIATWHLVIEIGPTPMHSKVSVKFDDGTLVQLPFVQGVRAFLQINEAPPDVEVLLYKPAPSAVHIGPEGKQSGLELHDEQRTLLAKHCPWVRVVSKTHEEADAEGLFLR
jgi:hypothetical protein